jgi:hypothetical protein
MFKNLSVAFTHTVMIARGKNISRRYNPRSLVPLWGASVLSPQTFPRILVPRSMGDWGNVSRNYSIYSKYCPIQFYMPQNGHSFVIVLAREFAMKGLALCL